MTKEQEIISWLGATYEMGKETDVTPKESLWIEFAKDSRVAESGQALNREEFFSHLGRCISQCSLRGIKTMRCKGKKTGYKGLPKKQGQNTVRSIAEIECIKTGPCKREEEEERENGTQETIRSAHDISPQNDSSLHISTKQAINDVKKVDEREIQSCHYSVNSQKRGKSDVKESGDDQRVLGNS